MEHLTGLLEHCRMDARQAKATELVLSRILSDNGAALCPP
jgi:hypothetical protein